MIFSLDKLEKILFSRTLDDSSLFECLESLCKSLQGSTCNDIPVHLRDKSLFVVGMMIEDREDVVFMERVFSFLLFFELGGAHLLLQNVADAVFPFQRVMHYIGGQSPCAQAWFLQAAYSSDFIDKDHVYQVCKAILSNITAASAGDLFPFIRAVVSRQVQLAPLLREAMVFGQVGEWVVRITEKQIPTGQVSNVVTVLLCFQRQDWVERFVRQVEWSSDLLTNDLQELLKGGLDSEVRAPLLAFLSNELESDDSERVHRALCFLWEEDAAKVRLKLKDLLCRSEQWRMVAYAHMLRCEAAELDGVFHRMAWKEKHEHYCAMFALASSIDPDQFSAALTNEEFNLAGDLSSRVRHAFGDFLLEQRDNLQAGLKVACPASELNESSKRREGKSRKRALFRKEGPSLAETLKRNKEASNKVFENVSIRGMDLSGVKLDDVTANSAVFESVTFLNAYICASSLREGIFRNVVFENCSFSKVDFVGSLFQNSKFRSCEFSQCTFSQSRFENIDFLETVFSLTSFTSACFVEFFCENSTFETCYLCDARIEHATIQVCSILHSHFRNAVFVSSTMTRTFLEMTDFSGSRMDRFTVSCSDVRNCFVDRGQSESALSVWADDAFFSSLRLASLDAKCLSVAFSSEIQEAPDECTAQEGVRFMIRAITLWLVHQQMARNEAAMLRENDRRLSKARAVFSQGKRDVVDLIAPLLQKRDIVEKRSLKKIPECVIENFATTQVQERLLDKYFPVRAQDSGKSPDLEISGVYAMGSLGSVAQVAASDVDCWVCLKGNPAPSVREGLVRKVRAIESWLEEQFGLEAYFFVMTIEEIRRGQFGLTDKESSGSAQSLLLKEEFYRTATKIAGSNLAWWYTPAYSTGKDLHHTLRYYREYPLSGPNRVMDLGEVRTIPRKELFGACLWQIVKALKSPFKSVMKLGVVEFYASLDESGQQLLNEELKTHLLKGGRAFWQTDPYLVLFQVIHDFYSRLNDSDALQLSLKAFVLKTELGNSAGLEGRSDKKEIVEWLRNQYGYSFADEDYAEWTLETIVEMTDTVSRFITSAYKRIASYLQHRGHQTETLITPEDMTRLGRQISAAFSRKKDKVERAPFIKLVGESVKNLSFGVERDFGKQPVWSAKTLRGGVDGKTLLTIRSSQDICGLLSWLVANGIYDPNVHVYAESALAPLAIEDVKNLLERLRTHFPLELFDINPEEHLRAERVDRAFFILNPTQKRDQRLLKELVVVYSTNWGELFCSTFANPGQIPHHSGLQFLQNSLSVNVDGFVMMEQFIPKQVVCPKVVLA